MIIITRVNSNNWNSSQIHNITKKTIKINNKIERILYKTKRDKKLRKRGERVRGEGRNPTVTNFQVIIPTNVIRGSLNSNGFPKLALMKWEIFAKSLTSTMHMWWLVFTACSAKAQDLVLPSLLAKTCSLTLWSIDQPISPMYEDPHEHVMTETHFKIHRVHLVFNRF